MRKEIIFAVIAIIVLLGSSSQAITITTAYGNGADTYLTNDGKNGPESVFGSNDGIEIRNYDGVRQRVSLIRFDLSDITGDMMDAVLSLNVGGNRERDWSIYGLIDESLDFWDEETTSYSNAPGMLVADPGSYSIDESILQPLGSFHVVNSGYFTSNPAALNLDSFISSDTNRLLTFAIIFKDGNTSADWWITTKEYQDPTLAPKLELPNSVPEPTLIAMLCVGGIVILPKLMRQTLIIK